MARRKSTRRFDPRYFMSEKTDIIKEGMRMSPEDLDRQDFEKMAQLAKDDERLRRKIENVEVGNLPDSEDPPIPYAKVTFLNGDTKFYYNPSDMERDFAVPDLAPDLPDDFEL